MTAPVPSAPAAAHPLLLRLLRAWWRPLFPFAAVLLPTLLLIVLGVRWLVEHEYFLVWCLLTTCCALASWLVWITRPEPPANLHPTDPDAPRPSPGWSPLEHRAWDAVLALGRQAAASPPADLDTARLLGQNVLATVARTLHPDDPFSAARFTVPDVLLGAEQALGALRHELVVHVPGADVLRVSQILSAHDLYQRYGHWGNLLWNVWRATRMVTNPVTGLVQELGSLALNQGRRQTVDHLHGALAQRIVHETGWRAIELYAGRLRALPAQGTASTAPASAASATHTDGAQTGSAHTPRTAAAPPVRLLLVGQPGSGRSSLLNALLDDIVAPTGRTADPLGALGSGARLAHHAGTSAAFTTAAHALRLADGTHLQFHESPGLDGSETSHVALLALWRSADLVLWTVNANVPARSPDAAALGFLRDWSAAHPEHLPPGLLLIATHVDLLPPRRAWSPPYDIVQPQNDKARHIRAALEAIRTELQTATDPIVPICARPADPKHPDPTHPDAGQPEDGPYNIDAVHALIGEWLPSARHASLRRTHESAGGLNTRRVLEQCLAGGRFLGKLLLRRHP